MSWEQEEEGNREKEMAFLLDAERWLGLISLYLLPAPYDFSSRASEFIIAPDGNSARAGIRAVASDEHLFRSCCSPADSKLMSLVLFLRFQEAQRWDLILVECQIVCWFDTLLKATLCQCSFWGAST